MARTPFFILHDSRSGSTFTADRIIRESDCSIMPESNFLTPILKMSQGEVVKEKELFERIVDRIFQEKKFLDWGVPQEQVLDLWPGDGGGIRPGELIRGICSLFDPKIQEGVPWGFKKGNYAFHFHLLEQVFDRPLYLIMVRDGRAIFHSKKNSINPDLGTPFETDPGKAAALWVTFQKWFRRIQKKAPDRSFRLIIGKHGSHWDRFAELLEEHGLMPYTDLCEHLPLPKLHAYLSLERAILIDAMKKPFQPMLGGLSREALSLGCPVITAKDKEHPIFQQIYGKECPLFFANEEKEIEKQLESLMSMNGYEWESLSQRIRDWGYERLHWENRIDELITFLEGVINKNQNE